MSQHHCEQEERVSAALRGSGLERALMEHIDHCAICAEVMLVTQFLAEGIELVQPEINLPDAGFLWWKAQLRSRNAALARATRPIDFVTIVGAGAVTIAGLWSLSTSAAAREWVTGALHPRMLQSAGGGYWGELALAAAIGTAVCVLIGSLFTLRA